MCTITIEEFKNLFDRGQFYYGLEVPGIRDKDILEALNEALNIFNGDLYPDDETCKRALSYLTAHFLILDIDGASGQSIYNVSSRSAGGISESLSIPLWMQEGDFAMYATTFFGQKYLMLSKPFLDGAVFVVSGATTF